VVFDSLDYFNILLNTYHANTKTLTKKYILFFFALQSNEKLSELRKKQSFYCFTNALNTALLKIIITQK